MKAVRSLVRLGRQTRSRSADAEDRIPLHQQNDVPDAVVQPREISRPPSSCSTVSDADSTCSLNTNVKNKR